jgi:hypothetical protein
MSTVVTAADDSAGTLGDVVDLWREGPRPAENPCTCDLTKPRDQSSLPRRSLKQISLVAMRGRALPLVESVAPDDESPDT